MEEKTEQLELVEVDKFSKCTETGVLYQCQGNYIFRYKWKDYIFKIELAGSDYDFSVALSVDGYGFSKIPGTNVFLFSKYLRRIVDSIISHGVQVGSLRFDHVDHFHTPDQIDLVKKYFSKSESGLPISILNNEKSLIYRFVEKYPLGSVRSEEFDRLYNNLSLDETQEYRKRSEASRERYKIFLTSVQRAFRDKIFRKEVSLNLFPKEHSFFLNFRQPKRWYNF
jgi:hypothetical protein